MDEAQVKAKPSVEVLERVEEIKVPPGELGATLELIVRKKNGEVRERQIMLSESFVQQFLIAIYIHAGRFQQGRFADPIKGKDTDDNDALFGSSVNANFSCNAPVNNDTYGVMVGTGITAPTVTDTKMETKIAHGIGAGQMQYSAVTFGAPTSDGSTAHFTITRDFANNSGGSITVREIGLYSYLYSAVGGSEILLMIRDAVNIAVPDGETLTVNYRIQATA